MPKAYGAVDLLLIPSDENGSNVLCRNVVLDTADRAPEVREAAEYHLEQLKCLAPQ